MKAAGMLEGKEPEATLAAKAAETAAGEASPIDDIRASAWYRKQIARQMVARILGELA